MHISASRVGERRAASDRARALGWISFGLGSALIGAPDWVARTVGLEENDAHRAGLRAVGAREIASGLGIFFRPRSGLPVWLRVAGDAIDLGLLGTAFQARRRRPNRLLAAIGVVAGIAVIDALVAGGLSRIKPSSDAGKRRDEITSFGSITIDRAPADIRAAWEKMKDEEPTRHGEPMLSPAPGGRGTEVRLRHGRFAGRLVEAKLRRLKQRVETGEPIASDASIHRGLHPAQPSADRARGKDWFR